MQYTTEDYQHTAGMNYYTTKAWLIHYPNTSGGTGSYQTSEGSQTPPVTVQGTDKIKTTLTVTIDSSAMPDLAVTPPSTPGNVFVGVHVDSLFNVYTYDGTLVPGAYLLPTPQVNATYKIYTPPLSSDYDNLPTQLEIGFYGGYVEYVQDTGGGDPAQMPSIQGPDLVTVGRVGTGFSSSLKPTFANNGFDYTLEKSYICTTTSQTSQQVASGSCGTERDSSLTTRNPQIGYPGTVIVAVYSSKGNPTKTQNSTPGPSGTDMDPASSGVVKSYAPDSGQFDVLQGIPTSEYLYTNVLGKDYLYNYQFNLVQGEKTYPVTVTRTYNLSWDTQETDSSGNTTTVHNTATQTVSKSYMVKRPYSYYEIGTLEVYGLNNATVENYALPNGSVTMNPSGYTAPTLNTYHSTDDSYHIIDPVNPNTTTMVNSGSESATGPNAPSPDLSSYAEAAVGNIKVRNDKAIFTYNGSNTTVMDDTETPVNGPVPASIPGTSQIGSSVLYAGHLQIDPQKANQQSAPSFGTIDYHMVANSVSTSGTDYSQQISGINPVTVHTPVVDYSTVSDDSPHNQKTVPSQGLDALILGRNFTVTVPTSGQHRNIPGYGNNNYAKYTEDKQVSFPFDVYAMDGTAIQANTWIHIPVMQDTMQFYLPVWVDEGSYQVSFREIAINTPQDSMAYETHFNNNLNNYIATQQVPVDVIGRVFDFHITDIADYNWQSVFRTSDGTTPTGNSYWVGDKNIDGAPRGNQPPFILPVAEGSNPTSGYKNAVVKTGYHIKFDLKTMGNMFSSNDGVRITPSFYFVSKKGGTPQPVDLYYQTQNNAFVKIGSSQDTEKRYVILNTPLRNVPDQELTDTSNYLYDHGASGGSSRSDFYNQYLLSTQKQTWVGNYDLMVLTAPLRTFIGSKSNLPSWVDPERANASIQKWYGDYSLPAAPYVVLAGTDLAAYAQTNTLDDHSSIFKHDGYIVVNFNIETIQNEDLDHPHLQYINGPLDNQWQMEGYHNIVTDPYGNTFDVKDGDVIFYDADHSSRDDFGSGQTH